MIFTIVGDPHAKADNLDKIKTLFALIEEQGNTTIILGDLLDTKEIIRGSCLNTYIDCFKKSKLEFIILTGNHDWFNGDCEQHSLEPLKLLPNVKIIDKPTELGEFVFLPFLPQEELNQIIPKLPKKPLFCHVDMPGFDYGNGHVSEIGVDKSKFSKFPIVISGHYHKQQNFENIHYLGTPFSHSFGESNQQKYLGLYNSTNNSLEYLALHNFPSHITQEIDVDTGNDKLHGYTKEDKVRFFLKGSRENINKYKKEPGIKYVEVPTQSLNKSNGFLELHSPQQQFTKWSKQRKLSEETKTLGLGILKDVL